MTGKNPEFEAKHYEVGVNEGKVLASVPHERWEEVSRVKDIRKRVAGENVSSAGEKSESSPNGDRLGRSPDTINAYRTREPRAESHESVDTINAYRSREPGLESPYWADTEDEP